MHIYKTRSLNHTPIRVEKPEKIQVGVPGQ
jgi:hypothetical protein